MELPACPSCKAPIASPERVYKVTVEPEEGERGLIQKDVGLFRCPRCDKTIPRVMGRVHYLLVPETEFNRLKKSAEENEKKAEKLNKEMEALAEEKIQQVESLNSQLRDSVITRLEGEVRQLERHVKQLKSERDHLKVEAEGM
jgi:hypothetical protein